MSRPEEVALAVRGSEAALEAAEQGVGPEGGAGEVIVEGIAYERARVEDLALADGEGSRIPPEVYGLVATVLGFAQELNDLRRAEKAPESHEG